MAIRKLRLWLCLLLAALALLQSDMYRKRRPPAWGWPW